jgi:hypothetical protein
MALASAATLYASAPVAQAAVAGINQTYTCGYRATLQQTDPENSGWGVHNYDGRFAKLSCVQADVGDGQVNVLELATAPPTFTSWGVASGELTPSLIGATSPATITLSGLDGSEVSFQLSPNFLILAPRSGAFTAVATNPDGSPGQTSVVGTATVTETAADLNNYCPADGLPTECGPQWEFIGTFELAPSNLTTRAS